MKILYYCQHVLGLGHFFRTLEICRALDAHEVVLVSGGPAVDTEIPPHIRQIRLPSLEMDAEFKAIRASDPQQTLEKIKNLRRRELKSIFVDTAPDQWIIELYPFGRKAFRFELDPMLADISDGRVPACQVICSLRDILVEKKDQLGYEQRVIDTLNRYFSALLIHADPSLVQLDETFTQIEAIRIPKAYTGFVTPRPRPDARQRIRRKLELAPDQYLVVASAGGGRVGARQLEAVVRAIPQVAAMLDVQLLVFSGPYMAVKDVDRLRRLAGDNVRVRRFTPAFLDHLAAADLSISMAGYNTCMNIAAAQVPALVWPFSQNREQRMRAEKLEKRDLLKLLTNADLDPERLAQQIVKTIRHGRGRSTMLDLDGARNTARWLADFAQSQPAGGQGKG